MSDLTGADLDKAVAEATGNTHYLDLGEAWHPSTNWAQLGPLIEEYRIEFDPPAPGCIGRNNCSLWYARVLEWTHGAEGETPLIAACRAIVASKEEV